MKIRTCFTYNSKGSLCFNVFAMFCNAVSECENVISLRK